MEEISHLAPSPLVNLFLYHLRGESISGEEMPDGEKVRKNMKVSSPIVGYLSAKVSRIKRKDEINSSTHECY